jgi:hypothetical protein
MATLGGNMQVGSLVRYQYKYPDGMEVDWIGIVAKVGHPHPKDWRIFYWVQWSNGLSDWRAERDLEVICE